ncbi:MULTISPECIES: CRISPR-associated ring nuclease Csm6 [unclassified Thiocapsa]|uniref:CRISPR-associated ring nuclease Csm6 n=1 Tax=unclassified Thiocapsa TaxID=2641286 RepID=UPI0035AE67A9
MSTPATPRRLLIAVTGLTPQVVTETLYVLACRTDPPWIPSEVHLITTATGANNARLNLLGGKRWFHRLCEDYRLPPIAFPEQNIHVLQGDDGLPLEDIRTQAHNTLAANFITETLRALTEDPNTEIHVSIAGGRKTMGYYLGYALSLYGRPQDRLSHVLVSDPYETNRDFYYPTPYEHPIHSKRGDKEITVDARNADVDLASIPFVQLRDGLPERLRTGQAGFTQVVAMANRGLRPPRLILNPDTYEAWADDEALDLGETEFLILLWLAERAQRGESATDWSCRAMAEEFQTVVRRVANPMSGHLDRIAKAFADHDYFPLKTAKYFEPHKSRIKKTLEHTLGERPAERYAIARSRDRETAYYFLPLDPEQIEIRRT